MRLRREGHVALWGSVALVVAAALSGSWVVATGMVPVLLVIGAGLYLRTPRVTSLTRKGLEGRHWTGAALAVEWEVAVRGVGLVAVYDSLAPQFELTSGNTYRVFWSWGEATRRFSYTVVCRKRGVYAAVATRWRSWHGLLLRGEAMGDGANGVTVEVMPRPAMVPYLVASKGRTRLPPVGNTLTKVGNSTTDFRDVRQYVPGDPFKSINWKATARRLSTGAATILTNQYESEGRRVVWVLADASSHMNVGDSLRNPLEMSVHLAMGASHYFLKRGYVVGLCLYGGDRPILRPDAGRKQLLNIARCLTRVSSARQTEGLPSAVERIRVSLLKESPITVVLSRLDMPEPGPLLDGVRQLATVNVMGRARPAPIVVGVSGYHFASADGWYARNARLLMDVSTRPVIASLRALGAQVLEWRPPAESDWARFPEPEQRT